MAHPYIKIIFASTLTFTHTGAALAGGPPQHPEKLVQDQVPSAATPSRSRTTGNPSEEHTPPTTQEAFIDHWWVRTTITLLVVLMMIDKIDTR